ncbi:hypothetical protein V7S43_007214 [Phytophthora oleae]|uniref:CSC1/OSCA1-like 7TM region domain-containing protein n=1 Tax=Phytophthora oleae TaxID=2107226 RepID=A0ABD3FPN2_9STRA
MASLSDEGVEETSELRAPVGEATLSSIVFQTDDLGASIGLKGLVSAPNRKYETAPPLRISILTPRSSGGTWPESQGPRPSIATVVATEVATFYEVFGFLGVPMLIVFVLSAAWTFMLAVIQVHANEMANTIMNTTEFDGGNFWLLPQPDKGLEVSSVVLLSLFGAGYTGLAVMMLFFYKTGHEEADVHDNSSRKLAISAKVPARTEGMDVGTLRRFVTWFRNIPLDVRQHYYTAVLDLPKLVFQTLTLSTYLQKGFPTPIIYYYSVLLLCNWPVASYRNQRYVADPALILARLYYTFDLFFAVFAPLVVLIYFITSFNFDRGAFIAKTETLTPGTFDTVPEFSEIHRRLRVFAVLFTTCSFPRVQLSFTNLHLICCHCTSGKKLS